MRMTLLAEIDWREINICIIVSNFRRKEIPHSFAHDLESVAARVGKTRSLRNLN
jgi:hypothetical protein